MHSCTQPAEHLNNSPKYPYVDSGWPGHFQVYLHLFSEYFFIMKITTHLLT